MHSARGGPWFAPSPFCGRVHCWVGNIFHQDVSGTQLQFARQLFMVVLIKAYWCLVPDYSLLILLCPHLLSQWVPWGNHLLLVRALYLAAMPWGLNHSHIIASLMVHLAQEAAREMALVCLSMDWKDHAKEVLDKTRRVVEQYIIRNLRKV